MAEYKRGVLHAIVLFSSRSPEIRTKVAQRQGVIILAFFGHVFVTPARDADVGKLKIEIGNCPCRVTC